MNSRTPTLLLVALAAFLVGGVVSAQTDDEIEVDMGSFEKNVDKLSGPQKIKNSEEKIRFMRGVKGETDELLDKTRKQEPDIIKLTCINEKLAAIKGFLKVSEQSYGHLKNSVATNDKEAEKHHFTLISIAAQKTKTLGEEARICVGEVLRYAKDSKLVVTIDPDVASPTFIFVDDDPYWDDYATQRLPELTPFQ